MGVRTLPHVNNIAVGAISARFYHQLKNLFMTKPIDHGDKIHSLLSGFDTAMLVTHGRDGLNHARPMGIARLEPNCDLWFFTGRVAEKVREIQHDSEVHLIFQKDHKAYISLIGRAQLVQDKAKATELWKPAYRVWFPHGPDDGNILLIRVSATEAEYWDNTGFNGVKYLFEAVKAAMTAKTPQVQEPDQHGRVKLK